MSNRSPDRPAFLDIIQRRAAKYGVPVALAAMAFFGKDAGVVHAQASSVETPTPITTPKSVENGVIEVGDSCIVTAKKLNVRSGPGTNHTVVDSLSINDVVTIKVLVGGWAQVSRHTVDSQESMVIGWVSKNYVKEVGSEPTSADASPSPAETIDTPSQPVAVTPEAPILPPEPKKTPSPAIQESENAMVPLYLRLQGVSEPERISILQKLINAGNGIGDKEEGGAVYTAEQDTILLAIISDPEELKKVTPVTGLVFLVKKGTSIRTDTGYMAFPADILVPTAQAK